MARRLRPGWRWVAALLALVAPTGLAAQRPTLAPPLARALTRDTSFTVWLFVRPGVSLADAIVRAATQATGVPGIPAVRDLQK